MNAPLIRGVLHALAISAVLYGLAFGGYIALSAEAPAKVDPSWCAPSTEGFCDPVDPSVLAPIPPDAPPVVRLRHQLAKERIEHRAKVRAMRAALAACRDGR